MKKKPKKDSQSLIKTNYITTEFPSQFASTGNLLLLLLLLSRQRMGSDQGLGQQECKSYVVCVLNREGCWWRVNVEMTHPLSSRLNIYRHFLLTGPNQTRKPRETILGGGEGERWPLALLLTLKQKDWLPCMWYPLPIPLKVGVRKLVYCCCASGGCCGWECFVSKWLNYFASSTFHTLAIH